ncbi:MAG: hypothetical protein ACRDP9_23085 [Kribbellaceae bacterium]
MATGLSNFRTENYRSSPRFVADQTSVQAAATSTSQSSLNFTESPHEVDSILRATVAAAYSKIAIACHREDRSLRTSATD